MTPTVHLALLPACACGCTVHFVAYVDEGGLLTERELERSVPLELGRRLLAFTERHAAQFDWRAFPLTDAWMPLTAPPFLSVDYATLELRLLATILGGEQ